MEHHPWWSTAKVSLLELFLLVDRALLEAVFIATNIASKVANTAVMTEVIIDIIITSFEQMQVLQTILTLSLLEFAA